MQHLALIAVVVVFLVTATRFFSRRRPAGFPAKNPTSTAGRRSGRGSGQVSPEEVARHNTSSDLWLVINGKVYDFTDYLPLHPGGEAMLRNAGRDSTHGFSGSQHPARVWDMVS